VCSWDCVQKDINKCKIKRWRDGSNNTADWEKFVKEAKVRIGMYCPLTKRRRTKKQCI
jgi:hypothetical protein